MARPKLSRSRLVAARHFDRGVFAVQSVTGRLADRGAPSTRGQENSNAVCTPSKHTDALRISSRSARYVRNLSLART